MEKTLTSDQENAKNLIVEWFLNTDNRIFVLSGYAGTGKTFLINHVVQEVHKRNMRIRQASRIFLETQ